MRAAHAYGTGSGELTAIAYCARMKRPVITEVASSPAPVSAGNTATTTTPTCPAGKRLIAGGFELERVHQRPLHQSPGSFNPNGTWSATSYRLLRRRPQPAYGSPARRSSWRLAT